MRRAAAFIACIMAVTAMAYPSDSRVQEVPYLSLMRVQPGPSICPGGLCDADGLSPVFEAFARIEDERSSGPVRIVQLGDSHTAGGRITGRLRADLQHRFGYLPPPDQPQSAALRPGIQFVEIGVVGATLADAARWPDVSNDMLPGGADLTILAFGVNDGFNDAQDVVVFEALLRAEIARHRRPGTAVLILGAPDALRSGVRGGCSADGQRAPPANLAMVRDVQRRVAADMGVAYWDWHGRMGGDCSADRLALRDKPFMRLDRVHFTLAGADWIGGVLADDLMRAYDAWKTARVGDAP